MSYHLNLIKNLSFHDINYVLDQKFLILERIKTNRSKAVVKLT